MKNFLKNFFFLKFNRKFDFCSFPTHMEHFVPNLDFMNIFCMFPPIGYGTAHSGQKRPLAAHPESCLDLQKCSYLSHFWTDFQNILGPGNTFLAKNWKSAKNCKIYDISNISGKILEMRQKLGFLPTVPQW